MSDICERYANSILWACVADMILMQWDSIRKKIGHGG